MNTPDWAKVHDNNGKSCESCGKALYYSPSPKFTWLTMIGNYSCRFSRSGLHTPKGASV